VRLAHLWAGLVLCLLLALLGATGSALTYKEAYWRLVHPELRGPLPDPGPAGHAAAIQAARERFGDELRSVKLPEPGVAGYHLYLQDGEAFLAADDHRVLDRWRPRERPVAFLFDLHAHLLAGETGERVGGVVGLLGALLVGTGVYLWWPARRKLRPGTLLPRDLSRRQLLPSHRDLGLVATPVLAVLLLTGAGIVFYGAAGTLLNGLFGDPPQAVAAPPTLPAEGTPGPTRATLVAEAQAAFPDARLVFYYPPAPGSAVHGFRLKRPCELHPNGRSYVYTDGDGAVLARQDACAAPPGQKALHAVYPLHAGKAGSGAWTLAVFLGGLALTLVSATGAGAYAAKLRAGEARRRADLRIDS
jgi:uncharacterized iron-regulated membrane protein